MFTITIAGVDRSGDIKLDSFRIEAVLGSEQDRLNFIIKSGAKPVTGQSIIVTQQSTRKFGGIISRVKDNPVSPGLIWYECEAIDYGYQLDKELVVEEYGGVNVLPRNLAQVFDEPWISEPMSGNFTMRIDGGIGKIAVTGDIEYEIELFAGESTVFDVDGVITLTPEENPTKVILSQNVSATVIVNDILSRYCVDFTNVGVQTNGPMVEYIRFDYKHPSECFTELADYCGWHWYVDYYKDVKFFGSYTEEAPHIITDASDVRNLKYDIDIMGLRNRVYVKGGTYLSDPFPHTIIADGVARAWALPHKPHNMTAQVNEAPVRVGIENEDEEALFDYMVNQAEQSIRCAAGTSTPTAGASLSLEYQYEMPVISMKEDKESQAAVAAVQGGDGVYEDVIVDESLTTLDAAEALCIQHLEQNKNPKVTGSFTTFLTGWDVGQLVTINSVSRGINNAFLIQRVTMTPVSNTLLEHHIEFGGRLLGLEAFLKNIVSAQQKRRGADTGVMSKFEYLSEAVAVADSLSTTFRTPPYYCGDEDAICGFVSCD